MKPEDPSAYVREIEEQLEQLKIESHSAQNPIRKWLDLRFGRSAETNLTLIKR